MAYRHLKKFKIDPILYMTEWFMCIFSRTLPWSCVLRVWDMFFCEGQSYTLENKRTMLLLYRVNTNPVCASIQHDFKSESF